MLVIDDSKTIRRTAETLLAKEGCEVFTAVDGFDALAKIADHQPDIVFVDIMMPRLDGYQTCSLIKHNKVFRSIPVIMLSSKDGLFDRARGRIVGSEHYLTKPFTTDELLVGDRDARQPGEWTRTEQAMALILIVDDSPTEVHVMQKAARAATASRPRAPADGAEGDPQGPRDAARPDPDGHRDAGHERLPGDAHARERSGDARDPGHHGDFTRARKPTASGACARARSITS